ncbi:hypothetical protein KIMH_15100 [Bombiscardovia apis]|uniref:Uncharacterized protein n=1 Tax=Bombiscardovia apis TaxID=2932182 RepID=A0ABN6SH99_9BIFI|nr:hypothetical protein KIMH_15100 [Bombiscardovia apis]
MLDMPNCVFAFIYIYILMSYIRWYIPALLKSRKTAFGLIIFGVTFGYAYQWVLTKIALTDWWLFHTRNATSLAISLGLIILAINRPETHSRIVNKLASATLGVFLIQISSLGAQYSLLTKNASLGEGVRLFVLNFLLALIFFIACLTFDLLRQLFFAFTVDKIEGKLFEWFYRNMRKFAISYSARHFDSTRALN